MARRSNKGTTLAILHKAISNRVVTRALRRQLPINQVARLTLPTLRLSTSKAKVTNLIPILALLQLNNTVNSPTVLLLAPTSPMALLLLSNTAIILHRTSLLNQVVLVHMEVLISKHMALHSNIKETIPHHNTVKARPRLEHTPVLHNTVKAHHRGRIQPLHSNTEAHCSIQETYPSLHMASTMPHILGAYLETALLREVEAMEDHRVIESTRNV